jgi:ribosomal protein S18 acetylase RimI-like enzyme
MHIQTATKSDIPAIMRVERVEGYAHLVGRWDAEQHAAEIDKPSNRYLVGRDGTEIAGFAILQGVGSANQCIRLRRIAVGNAGRGFGSVLLRSVLQICFDDLAAHRVELHVFAENERAYRTYLKNGFTGRRHPRPASGCRRHFSIDAPDVDAQAGMGGAALTDRHASPGITLLLLLRKESRMARSPPCR